VFIPNTFTPNGDGVNDRFYVSGRGLGAVTKMAIYNRWGELVYEGTGARANDPGFGWDGTYKGEVLAPDVFVYVIEVQCTTGEPFTFRGDISLIR
jgi:gliding motility-associated-like protein